MAEHPLRYRDLAELDVGILRSVGAKRRQSLGRLGIETVLDLLMTYPRRYLDRTREARVADLVPGDEAMVLGVVRRVESRRSRRGKPMVVVSVSDGSGSVQATFFNQPWRARQLSEGTSVVLFGSYDRFRGRGQFTNPVVDLVGDRTGRIVPVYPQSDKERISTDDLARAVEEALRRSAKRGMADPVPAEIRERLGLIGRERAMRGIHVPETMTDRARARDRLVFDELLRLQLALLKRKRELDRDALGFAHQREGELIAAFEAAVPFELTGAQRRAIDEIRADMASSSPMHRLLQGDVGAGKTLVAVAALLTAVQGGHQAALLAPTEVLAEQHLSGVRQLVEGLEVPDPSSLMGSRPVRVELLTGRMPASERRRILAGLAEGQVELLVGTHALLTEGVDFSSLGLVVVDEQHRFGVEQRALLRERAERQGATPDVLVMTATPIPRTAALTVYGDLDVSVLDELPAGRTPIVTEWARTPDEADAVWEQVRIEVAAGRQAYVVCPLITESEASEVRAAEQVRDELAEGELAGIEVGLLHGRLGAHDKELTMDLFRRGRIPVLVATTVIEVGVDVPNATVMVILDADRFGIAQLHQLRGRVGRGSHRSRCYLLGEATTPAGVARLEALVDSTDGFALAEIDLELRGEGALMGERQTGRNDLRLASLRRDLDWIVRARQVAAELLDADPELVDHGDLVDEIELMLGTEEAVEGLMRG